MAGWTEGNALANCKLDRAWMRKQLGIPRGCAYAGTMVCHICPFAERIGQLCEYKCHLCYERWHCPCGTSGQEKIVEAILGHERIQREVGNGNGHRDDQGKQPD